jgi:hypothetical protein
MSVEGPAPLGLLRPAGRTEGLCPTVPEPWLSTAPLKGHWSRNQPKDRQAGRHFARSLLHQGLEQLIFLDRIGISR